jgi:hypothetical protein
VLALLGFFLVAAGCRAPQRVEDGALVRVTVTEARVDAFPGRTLVVPIDLAPLIINPDAADPDRAVTGLVPVTLEDGRTLAGEVFRIGVRPGTLDRRRSWLERPSFYDARSAREYSVRDAAFLDPIADPGFWVVTVDLPDDAPQGAVRIAGERAPVVWREPWRAPRRSAPPAPVTPRQSDSLDRFRPAGASPADRWRLRLLADRRTPGMPSLATLVESSLGHPALDALARSLTDRWRLALSLVGDADPDLAGRFSAAITRVVFDGDLAIPAWSADNADAARLLDNLLDPMQTPAGRAEIARVWLEAQPRALAWALDDAGVRRPGSGINPVRIGVAELAGEQVLAGAETPDGRRGPRVVIAPNSVGACVVAVTEREAPTFVRAQVGEVSIGVPVVAAPAPAQPPGARLGPLSPVRTMREWLAGAESAPDPAWACAALLTKDPGQGVWRLYIECRVPPDTFMSARGADDIVRVFLGASGAPAAVLRVRASGEVTDEVSFKDLSSEATVTRERDRWTAILPIPSDAADPDGVLRIALERLDAGGGRATWPRAVLPWREEPGRVAIDLTAWNELRSAD